MEAPSTPHHSFSGDFKPSPSDPSSDRRALEQTIACLERELIGSQRLAALGTMAAMIAHEFNNLMTPILPRVEFALSTGAAADMRRALERIQTQVHRAIAVTQRLLDLAHDQHLPSEPCRVAPAVQEAIETAARPFEKDGIELSLSVPEDLRVQAQPDLFVQTMLNLLLNARTAMKESGGPLKISAWRDGRYVRIDVRDSGTGLSPAQIDKVINPFLAASDASGRDWQVVGLGLSVCRLIAQKHGATLQAHANEGRGCTFRLQWPAA